MGGVGGEHLITLARHGIGRFTIADPDTFELANFNRQHGATCSNLGRNKAEAMADMARDINPEIDIRVMPVAVDDQNVDAFLEGADLFVDGFDAFEIDARRRTFAEARQRGLFAVGAGPIGFGAALVAFDPEGMSFDRYCNLENEKCPDVRRFKFLLAQVPALLHRGYMDPSAVSIKERRGPSSVIGCKLAAGEVGAECVKILLGRGPRYAAPHYLHYDAYRQCFVRRRLRFGNRHPLQRAKLWWVKRTYA